MNSPVLFKLFKIVLKFIQNIVIWQIILFKLLDDDHHK